MSDKPLDSNASSAEENETEIKGEEADFSDPEYRAKHRQDLTRTIYHTLLELLNHEEGCGYPRKSTAASLPLGIISGVRGVCGLWEAGMRDSDIKEIIESTLEVLDERTPPRTRGPRRPQ